jgi:hypothetical protein
VGRFQEPEVTLATIKWELEYLGKAGHLLTRPKRTEKFGITPETFQVALAKGVPAVPLIPVAKPNVEKTKETA